MAADVEVLRVRFEACQQREQDERERTHARLASLEGRMERLGSAMDRLRGGYVVAVGFAALLGSAGGVALLKALWP